MEKVQVFLAEHRWTVVFTFCGVILAVLLLTVGFWKTLLILAFAVVFGLAGYMLDRDGGASAKASFDRLFHKNKE